MQTDKPTTTDQESTANTEAEIRAKAGRRSWICPGAGFAMVGGKAWAIATFVASFCCLPAAVWLTYRPTAVSFWITIVVVVIATLFWLAEQLAVWKASIRSPGPAILVRGFWACSGVLWLSCILAAGLIVAAFGPLRMVGSGMEPTIQNAERLLYYKGVDWQTIKPGAVILFKNTDDSGWGQPGWFVISRILAGPGDNLSMEGDRYVINGVTGPRVAETGDYEVVLRIPSSPESLTVPAGCYFVVQDRPASGIDSRVLSWVRNDHIVGSRLWSFSRRGFCHPVE